MLLLVSSVTVYPPPPFCLWPNRTNCNIVVMVSYPTHNMQCNLATKIGHAAVVVVASGDVYLSLLSALPLPYDFTLPFTAVRSDMLNPPH
jgi:hypothetical protein